MWSVIRNVINKCKPSKLNESFLYNNLVIIDKIIVSNKFNDYFVNDQLDQLEIHNIILHIKTVSLDMVDFLPKLPTL